MNHVYRNVVISSVASVLATWLSNHPIPYYHTLLVPTCLGCAEPRVFYPINFFADCLFWFAVFFAILFGSGLVMRKVPRLDTPKSEASSRQNRSSGLTEEQLKAVKGKETVAPILRVDAFKLSRKSPES